MGNAAALIDRTWYCSSAGPGVVASVSESSAREALRRDSTAAAPDSSIRWVDTAGAIALSILPPRAEIPDELHRQLLEQSLREHADLWRRLAQR